MKALAGDSMKKVYGLIAGIIVLALLLSGCQGGEKLKRFSDTSELENYASSFWVCETIDSGATMCYKVRIFTNGTCFSWDFSYTSEETLEQCLATVLHNCEETQKQSFHSATELLASGVSVEGLESQQYSIQYDVENSQINTADGQTVGVFLENGTYKSNGDIFYSDENLTEFSGAFVTAMSSIFTDTYGNLATYKDVKYDPLTYLGNNFILTGSAELDDYFNYDYRNLESIYFCICVTPVGGGYSDRWYIYCDRYKYKDLLEDLKEKSATNVMFICQGWYYDAIQQEMANLVDYCLF